MSSYKEEKSAAIQYLGVSGDTFSCKNAIINLFQTNTPIEKARLVTHSNTHAFLLSIDRGESLAIKSGFSSGYQGGGPTALSYVLALFEAFDIKIIEVEVDKEVIEMIDHSCLTLNNLEQIMESRPHHPNRIYDYVLEKERERIQSGDLWSDFNPVIPFYIVDPRISDLAISFWDSPGDKIMSGYKRFEDIIRERTNFDKHGSRLFSDAYRGEDAKLTWEGIEDGEHEGRIQLIVSSFKAYRNPRAHKENEHSSEEYMQEFLLLNHLFKLERDSVEVNRKLL